MKGSEILAARFRGAHISSRTKFGRLLSGVGVQKTHEWERIDKLPRRRWEDAKDIQELRELLTDLYFKPGCKGCHACDNGRMMFKPIQAAALRELHDWNGLFAPIPVGGGKSLISLMAGRVVDAKRPLLLVPASLRDQTRHEAIPLYGRHFQISDNLAIVGYSELSVASGAGLLEHYKPDLIIADEAHRLKNLRAAVTKEVKHYMDKNPFARVALLSGTMTKRSVLDYWHLTAWALKQDLMPLPRGWVEVNDWCKALDVNVPEESRIGPGALELWTQDGETFREGFARRLTETPGVIAAEGKDGVEASLRIIGRKPPMPETVAIMIRNMRDTWETPAGDIITEAVELWRHARELACGFWQKWDPAAPQPWLDARRAWNKYVRDTLSHNRRGLTRPLQVWTEVETAGDTHEAWGLFSAWSQQKTTFTPNPTPVWVSDYLVQWASKWLHTGAKTDPGIVWVEHVPFGRELAKVSGFPYFGAGPRAAKDVLTHQGPMIASIAAHGEGRNLQRYRRCLVVSPPNMGATWQQLLGRTHRHGQQADEVEWEVCLHAAELWASFKNARADALYRQQTFRQEEKLLLADLILDEVTMLKLEEAGAERWLETPNKKET